MMMIIIIIMAIIIIIITLACLHSAKGGAVETGCSDLYDVMY